MATVIKNGKEYSDVCFNCGEYKAAIKYSQSIKDPIYCVIMSYGEYAEAVNEYDRHCFVRTLKQKVADEAAELEACKQMGDMADFIMAEMAKEQ